MEMGRVLFPFGRPFDKLRAKEESYPEFSNIRQSLGEF